MAVFRVEKTKDFTIMCNHHLRNTELSLKAKGLLSLMLSLPEDWDYTTKGLAHICKDGVDSITTALKELERHGYLTRQRLRYENGQLGDIEYTIHEKPVNAEKQAFPPKRENPRQVNPKQAKPEQAEPGQENPAQLNTNPLKTKKLKTDISRTHPSIYPAEPEAAGRPDGMDRIELIEAYREIIKENIEYDCMVSRYGKERLDETMELMLYLLNTANLDCYEYYHPERDVIQSGPVAFSGWLEHMDCRPYRTEVQLYKSLLFLKRSIDRDLIVTSQREALQTLRCIISNLEYRFYKAYGMEIEDKRTVYGECTYRLVPREDEPSVCLMHDWIYLPSA